MRDSNSRRSKGFLVERIGLLFVPSIMIAIRTRRRKFGVLLIQHARIVAQRVEIPPEALQNARVFFWFLLLPLTAVFSQLSAWTKPGAEIPFECATG